MKPFEQIVDEVSKDRLIPERTGYSPEARQKAEALVKSFEHFLAEHKDEIVAEHVAAHAHRGKRRIAARPPRRILEHEMIHAREGANDDATRALGFLLHMSTWACCG